MTQATIRYNSAALDALADAVYKATNWAADLRVDRPYAEIVVKAGSRRVFLTVTKCSAYGVPHLVKVERIARGEKARKVTMTAANAVKAAAEWVAA